jgi:3-phosphoglycerate kinase
MIEFDSQPYSFSAFPGTYGINGGVSMLSHGVLLNCVNGSGYRTTNIQEMHNIARGGYQTFNNGEEIAKRFRITYANGIYVYLNEFWEIAESPVMLSPIGSLFTAAGGQVGNGWIYSQYFRDKLKGKKFGQPGTVKTVPTGASIKITPDSSGLLTINVLGGDSFTQRTYFKYRFPADARTQFNISNGGCNLGGGNYFCFKGFGMGVIMYCQNRINSQMRYTQTPGVDYLYPDATLGTAQWLESARVEPDTYQHGYDARMEINEYAEFNILERTLSKFPTRFIYSEIMAIGSLVDNLRTFLPGNIYDLPIKDGPVVHHELCNGEILAFQPYNFSQLYFNSNTLIPNSDGVDIIIGSGAVIRSKPKNLSSFGSKHKWGILKGKSDSGKDTVYWINSENGKVLRFGNDGTRNITVIKKMRTFFKKSLKWVGDYDTPADGKGICCVWDERNLEAIFTVRAKRKMGLPGVQQPSVGRQLVWEDQWSLGLDFQNGDIVSLRDYTGVPQSTFEQTGDYYLCIQNNTPDFFNRPGGTTANTYWKTLEELQQIIPTLKDGGVVLFENLRLHDGEKNNDKVFAESLARLGDVYVNDAFSVSHREHASVVGIPRLLPSFAGPLLEREVRELSVAFNPPHPFLFILGGAKFDTKLPLIEKFLTIADNVFIGGALANDIFKEKGFEVGFSVVSKKHVNLKPIISNKKLIIPKDVVVANPLNSRITRPDASPSADEKILDAGPETIASLADLLTETKCVVWNGPLGDYEHGFSKGTEGLARAIVESGVKSIVGGGDTVAVLRDIGLLDKFSFVSTGGGAMIDFLAQGTLPGIEALK